MISIRKKTKLISDLFSVFEKEGKVLTYEEYMGIEQVPVRMNTIDARFGSYGKMLNSLKLKHAKEWKDMEASFNKPKAKPEAKPRAVVEKATPKPKPATKPVVKKEKNDE